MCLYLTLRKRQETQLGMQKKVPSITTSHVVDISTVKIHWWWIWLRSKLRTRVWPPFRDKIHKLPKSRCRSKIIEMTKWASSSPFKQMLGRVHIWPQPTWKGHNFLHNMNINASKRGPNSTLRPCPTFSSMVSIWSLMAQTSRWVHA